MHPLIWGSALVALAGLISGSAAWPMKRMRQYQFEHWWFVGMVAGLVIIPWAVTLIFCPNLAKAFGSMPWRPLIIANLWAAGWGMANILCGICYVRLGMALTTAILAGVGLSIGAILPMIAKGSGIFQYAPGIESPAGLTTLAGVGVMWAATYLAGLAGFNREHASNAIKKNPVVFAQSLVMTMVAGILSSGMSLAFVYGQDAVVSAMERAGATHVPATFAVWAFCLLGGAVLCVVYPAYLMTKRKSWHVLMSSGAEMILAIVIGVNVAAAVALLGSGMLMLGALGASVGFGIQQAAWMIGGQGVGFLSGEWQDARGLTRKQMGLAIGLMLVAMLILACANALVRP